MTHYEWPREQLLASDNQRKRQIDTGSWYPTPHLQAPTRPATATLWPYVHVQIMIATILLSKCLTLRYFSQSELQN